MSFRCSRGRYGCSSGRSFSSDGGKRGGADGSFNPPATFHCSPSLLRGRVDPGAQQRGRENQSEQGAAGEQRQCTVIVAGEIEDAAGRGTRERQGQNLAEIPGAIAVRQADFRKAPAQQRDEVQVAAADGNAETERVSGESTRGRDQS